MQETVLEIDGSYIPIKVRFRKGNRVTGKLKARHAILHLPLYSSPTQVQNRLEEFKSYLRKSLLENPDLLHSYRPKEYKSGDEIHVGTRSYTLAIQEVLKQNHSAKLKKSHITLNLVDGTSTYAKERAIKTLLSRVIAKDFLPEISKRVHAINEEHFKVSINHIRLKYNHSNWGSCSSKGNINLSTRLLFAPSPVIDYVIIHELAHRLEPNHSPDFWAIVENIMPNYKEMEKWLRANQDQCDF